tara:strand:- start:227 stop:838 length:612 start_codon:yes stop_codon:yes gene_type:complete
MNNFNFAELTSKELLAYWNSYEGTKPIKKFRDKATAIRRCQELGDLVSVIESTGRTPKRSSATPEVAKQLTDTIESNGPASMNTPKNVLDVEKVRNNILNNVKTILKDVKQTRYARLPATPERKRNMSDSLSLDRTIHVTNESGKEWEFRNTHAMWKERPDWMSGAQVDRITRVLYTAAKQGVRTSVDLNGRTFTMMHVEEQL